MYSSLSFLVSKRSFKVPQKFPSINNSTSPPVNQKLGSELKQAAREGNLRYVITILENAQKVLPQQKGWALVEAAKNNHNHVVEALLEKCDKDIKPAMKGWALREAATKDYIEVANTILNHCVSDISDKEKIESLEGAAQHGRINFLANILENYEPKKIPEAKKCSMFEKGASNGYVEVVKAILDKYSRAIPPKNKGTAFQSAATNDYTNVALTILEKCGAEIPNNNITTVFKYAIKKGYIKLITEILNLHGTNMTARDKGNALMDAVKAGHNEVVAAILKDNHGEKIHDKDIDLAFSKAAKMGNLQIVRTILEMRCDAVSDENINRIFDDAAKNGHDGLIKAILQGRYGADEMSFKYKGQALKDAARNGYIKVIRAILDASCNKIPFQYKEQAFIQATLQGHARVAYEIFQKCDGEISTEDKKRALNFAIQGNHPELITAILSKHSAQMSGDDKKNALLHATSCGCIHSLNALLDDDSFVNQADAGNNQVLNEAIRIARTRNVHNNQYLAVADRLTQIPAVQALAGKEWIFESAVRSGRIDILTTTLKELSSEQYNYLKTWALSSVVLSSRLDLLNVLLADESVSRLAAHGNNNILRRARSMCFGFNSQTYRGIADRLMQIPEVQNLAEPAWVLEYAARNDMTELANSILQNEEGDISVNDKNAALEQAIRSGHFEMAFNIMNYEIDDIYPEHKGWMLERAVRHNKTEVVSRILDFCTSDISVADKRQAIQVACEAGHIVALNVLLQDESVLAQAAFDQNRALHIARSRIDASIDGAQYQKIVDRLLTIPMVQDIAQGRVPLAEIAQNEESSMANLNQKELDLVRHLEREYGHEYISWEQTKTEILSYVENRYQADPARDGYSRVWMLEAENTPVTYFPVDTIGLRVTGEDCEIAWHDETGIKQSKYVPLAEVLQVYNAVPNANSYLNGMSQNQELLRAVISRFDIPALPNQGQVIPLEIENVKLTPQALVALYRHTWHNAWRYLLNNNPLMAEGASWISDDGNGRHAVISNNDKSLMAYQWIALNDDKLELEEGFTKAGNLEAFAGVIKELNRGHNIDERALYAYDQEEYEMDEQGLELTYEDNLEGDEPTCGDGVTKRLVNADYGHPLTRMLNTDILKKLMRAHLIEHASSGKMDNNLFDDLKSLETNTLEYLREAINEFAASLFEGDDDIERQYRITEEETEKLNQALTIQQEHLDVFIKHLNRMFTSSRINEKCHPDESTGQLISMEKLVRNWAQELKNVCCANTQFTGEILTFLNNLIQKRKEQTEQASNTQEVTTTYTPSYSAKIVQKMKKDKKEEAIEDETMSKETLDFKRMKLG